MTTNIKRRSRIPKAPGLTGETREYLLTGHYFAPGKPDEGEARRCWALYKGSLLHYWIRDPSAWGGDDPAPAGPCCRPFAWWAYSKLPEPRRTVSPDKLAKLEIDRLGFSGIGPVQRALGDRPEADFEFLHRHRLLSVAELHWMANFPKVSFADWCLLFRRGWATAAGRTNHIRMWHGNLTEKGKECARQELAYWRRLGLDTQLPTGYKPELFDVSKS